MNRDLTKEKNYLLAKKRVDKLKGFYKHFISYILVNVFISIVIILGLMKKEGKGFTEVVFNFGVYATWIFWGIGVFFHWMGVFGQNLFFSKKWEEKKLQEYMKNEKF